MHRAGVKKFPYYVGVNSLADIATKEDRVCVLNILGNESKAVTPVSHEYSGGNVVFGTGPGRSGQVLETKLGPIPVYNSVKEGRAAGHKFNTAVIYLPPSGVKDGVAEVVRHNPDLRKIIILTEKISVHDARVIRAICQTNGVDVFGGNCLGVADVWNHVRIGGALGGNKPEESLVKGSIALFSNSGNFTTTIATYLLTKGWGTTTSISSGKDVYIHFAPKEFCNALDNDDRSKGAIIYAEPGGYYEHGLEINKPAVACVVGRWKAKLTKACGHAGSLAGSGDDARAKEKWFMDYFGVKDIYTPQNPVFSKKGAVVTNIAHIPEALTKVMELNKIKPDFEPKGDLSLKCWFGNSQGLKLPKELDAPVIKAIEPYAEQIELISKQVGAQYPRQTMKDASGASVMDAKTQVTKVHNVSILDASKKSLEENLVFSLIKDYPDAYGRSLANLAFNGYVNMHGDGAVLAADASRNAENSPNTVLSSAISIIGKGRVKHALNIASLLLDLFQHTKIQSPTDSFDYSSILKGLNAGQTDSFKPVPEGLNQGAAKDDVLAGTMLSQAEKLKGKSVFINFVQDAANGKPSSDALLAAIWITLGWGALMRKKISKATIINLLWYSRVFSAFIGCSVDSSKHKRDSFCGIDNKEIIEKWSFTEVAFLALIGRRPIAEELFEFAMLLGLIISNGPGTISAQGCKGGVSADGPEDPSRVQINKAFVGFLTHTGFAHGGNGYEAIAFLIDRFIDKDLKNPADKKHGLNLKTIADEYAKWYGKYKAKEKAAGNIEYMKVPCVNHPVFKGKAVNYDPRERFVNSLFEEKGIYNMFLDFYHNLVQSLFDNKVSENVYCVNIDAVIAVILLKMVWNPFKAGKITEKEVETAAFTTFLFSRMIGCAAEIDDHINRGRNMDTRTPASSCMFVG
ncbi:MAG: CoA-binding protein [Deltaproteobacteria bacterium RIFCSPLOWO2_12_FULL_43_16]|nr:MAG: CoA-binding protein [Deltaproteobacteria bacterium GWA2_43_19]OGQ11240.1 MAG: CoA-binding protein [Deltaproteobacteria bacterium RIFCSPHIGHO2_02_FULL_43_33]OGQ60481.1 MAG: CoA-binding protein [Deltaproteobacteria bacterium RIFCSPLOWO2_12_FULL_43_16]HBR17411.1 CoA-binding protein [Deltaproteobacteria bacterium]